VWTWPFAVERRATSPRILRASRPRSQNSGTAGFAGRNPFQRAIASGPTISRPILPAFWHGAPGVFPDKSVFNGFGMGALRGSDSVSCSARWRLIREWRRIYFPSGTPDLDDLRDGRSTSPRVAREVEEETGLTPADYVLSIIGTALSRVRRLPSSAFSK